MAFEYTTFANGNGYLFLLPSLGLPDPAGEWVTIQAALTTNHLYALDALDKAKAMSSPRRMRSPSGETVTVDVEHEGALWLLPILEAREGEGDPQVFTMRVRRVRIQAGDDDEGTTITEPETRDDSLSQAATALSLGDTSPATPRPTSPEAASSFRPLSPASASTVSLALADTSDDDDETSSSSESDSPSQSTTPHPQRRPQQTPMSPTIDISVPVGSRRYGETVITEEVAFGPLSRNIRYSRSLNWGSHFHPTLLHLQYVDVLPRGDPLPDEKGRKLQRESNTSWTVDFAKRTLYHKPAIPRAEREMIWRALLSSSGLPCGVGNGIITVDLGLGRHNFIRLPALQLRNGAAKLKVLPNPPDYACQPAGASAEASYFINRYQLVIEQGGKRFPAIPNLSGAYLDLNEEVLLCLLGQAAAATASSTESATRMVYAQQPQPFHGMTDLFNVGVRLRDGGSRYPVINAITSKGSSGSSSSGKSRTRNRFLMPGTAMWHAMYGDFDNLGILKRRDERELDRTREGALRMKIPPQQEEEEGTKLDVVFRVKEQEQGACETLQCAFRKQGCFEAIKEEEWMVVGPREMDGWAVEFLVAMARESVGFKEAGEGGEEGAEKGA